MTVTRNRVKVKQNGELQNYISYFQSVVTLGIINSAHSIEEAEDKAKSKFRSSDLACGIVGQTPFEISETEPWNPDFAASYMPSNGDKPNISFNMNNITRVRIAQKLCKPVQDVTDDDYVDFLKSALEKSLN